MRWWKQATGCALALFAMATSPDPAQAGFDGDGNLDAVFANRGLNRVCLGDGVGGFTCSNVSTDAGPNLDVAVGDVDDDGNLDAVFANDAARPAQVCLGDGAGGFTSCANVSTDILRASVGVAVGYIDGDSNLDAVFANSSVNNVKQANRVCLGNGDGTFGTPGTECSNVSADANGSLGVALGYVNGDGNLDAVFANGERGPEVNRVCLGDGTGGFTCADVTTDIRTSRGVALGYVNGDGNLDAVFANVGQPNRVCLGDGAGGFTCSDVSGDALSTFGVALGDVNSDDFLDAVFANSQLNRVCLGNGSGGFSSCTDVSTDIRTSRGVALGLVDGDTSLDAVFANFAQPNRVCLGNGDGTFGTPGTECSNVSADANNTLGVALAAAAASPQDRIDGLTDDIEDLVADGALSARDAMPLITKLEQATRSLERGDVDAACGQLGASQNQVDALVRSGRLSEEDGDALNAETSSIRTQIGC